jgi:hypothetical protein
MYGADGDPMMSPYSSFSIRITAMWAGPAVTTRAIGEGRRCTGGVVPGLERALLAPHAVSTIMVQIAEICTVLGRNFRVMRDMVLDSAGARRGSRHRWPNAAPQVMGATPPVAPNRARSLCAARRRAKNWTPRAPLPAGRSLKRQERATASGGSAGARSSARAIRL